MKKTAIVVALVAFALVLAGCGKKDQAQNQSGQNQTQQEDNSQMSGENKITGTIKDLLGMGKTLKCESALNNDKYSMNSITYISGQKIRSDISSQVEGSQATKSHSIIMDGWMYTWNEGMGTGTKFNMNDLNEQSEKIQTDPGQTTGQTSSTDNLENESDFTCSTWTVDESMFVLPANVVFADQTEMLKNPQNQTQPKGQSMCEICDTIQNADAKAQCKQSCGDN